MRASVLADDVPDTLLRDKEALLGRERRLAGGHRSAQAESSAEGAKDLKDLCDQFAGGQDDQSAQARDDARLQRLIDRRAIVWVRLDGRALTTERKLC